MGNFSLALLLLPQLVLGMQKAESSSKKTACPGEEQYLSQPNLDGTINGYRPPFYPDSPYQTFVTADLLVWQATVDGFAFAWTYPQVLNGNIREVPIPNGKFHDVDYDWAPGIRLGVGYHLPIDHWDLTLNWTGFRNHCTGHASVSSISNNSLIALWMPMGYIAGSYNALHAQAKWRLNYNTLDLSVGRTSFAVKSLVVNPVLGVRAAWIHQHFRADYSNGTFINSTGAVPSVRFAGSNQFNGWGIRPGLETSWHMTKDWSLYANSFISALFGVYTLKEDAYMTSATHGNLLNDYDRYFQNAFAFDMALGVKWEMFCGNKRHVLVSIGYEISSWFSQNQMTDFIYIDEGPGFGPYLNGDLGLQGIDISARFDF